MKDSDKPTVIASLGRLARYGHDVLKLDAAGIKQELRQWAAREGLSVPNSLIGEVASYVASSGEAAT